MTKIQVDSNGKVIMLGGKALVANEGGSATLITKNITQNGTYNASSDNADGYSSVTVNVAGTTPTGTLSITANGVYDVTNYASADVSVSGGIGQTPPYQGTSIILRCDESLSGATMDYYYANTGEEFEYTIIDSPWSDAFGQYYTNIVISKSIVDMDELVENIITITMPDGRSSDATIILDEFAMPTSSFSVGFPAA